MQKYWSQKSTRFPPLSDSLLRNIIMTKMENIKYQKFYYYLLCEEIGKTTQFTIALIVDNHFELSNKRGYFKPLNLLCAFIKGS